MKTESSLSLAIGLALIATFALAVWEFRAPPGAASDTEPLHPFSRRSLRPSGEAGLYAPQSRREGDAVRVSHEAAAHLAALRDGRAAPRRVAIEDVERDRYVAMTSVNERPGP